jgi:hypothetical protein
MATTTHETGRHVALGEIRVPDNVRDLDPEHVKALAGSQGRGGARCRRYRRSVSPTRPPNRTCPFLSIRLSTGHAVADLDAVVMRRRFPAGWWLGLFGCPPTARESGDRDSDIGLPVPRRASEASCLRGWSSGAPSTVA